MRIYLDNASTSFPKPDKVSQDVYQTLHNIGTSPGRGSLSREADLILFEAREKIARLFNIKSGRNIVFTPNATLSLNIAIKGLLKDGGHVITSSMEHNAVSRPIYALENKGVTKTVIPANKKKVDLDLLKSSITPQTKLIVWNHASNVSGAISPIGEIGELARSYKIPFLVDAAQTAGVIPINVESDSVDLLACTGHKALLGPQGTGFLYIREGVLEETLLEGGTGSHSDSDEMPLFLPDRFEAGTQNTPGIAGLSSGIDFIFEQGIDTIRKKEKRLVYRLFQGLQNIPRVEVYGPENPDEKVSIVSFNIKERDPANVGNILTEKFDIITRVGLHCAPWAHKSLDTYPAGSIRASIGFFNTNEDIDQLIDSILTIVKQKNI